jgi:site-specific recombinase XerD
VEYAVAAELYVSQAALTTASRRVYRISLRSWAWPLVGRAAPPPGQRRGAAPPVVPLALLDSAAARARLSAAVRRRAAQAGVRTVNRELSALRGAAAWWQDLGWIDRDPTTGLRHLGSAPAARQALSDRQTAALFRLPAGLREQALWRMLRTTGAPAEQLLSLNADEVDLAARRLRDRAAAARGGPVSWDEATSQLLRWLLAGRMSGPLFLTDRRAPATLPAADVCPVTGRARMSYRRAAEIFASATRPLDPAGRGWTLHQLTAAGK